MREASGTVPRVFARYGTKRSYPSHDGLYLKIPLGNILLTRLMRELQSSERRHKKRFLVGYRVIHESPVSPGATIPDFETGLTDAQIEERITTLVKQSS